MTVWVLLSLTASGLAVGFLAGLVGVGGGVLIVPLLYFFYGHAAWSGVTLPAELHAVVSHATSLLVIVPTSILGAWTYHRAELVAWRAALPIAVPGVAAALLASQATASIPAPALKLAFGVLLAVSGARLLRTGRLPEPNESGETHLAVAALGGVAVGALSALLGVGGGIVAIPILVYLVGLPLEKVAATSMGIIVLTALAGVAGYAIGDPPPVMPPGSVGYVHVVAALPIVVGALVAVRLGARVNQSLDTTRLRMLFGLVFMALGLRLVIGNLAALPGIG